MRLTKLMGRPMGFVGFMVPAAIADSVKKQPNRRCGAPWASP